MRRIDSCITQLKAQRPFRTCDQSKEEEEEERGVTGKQAASLVEVRVQGLGFRAEGRGSRWPGQTTNLRGSQAACLEHDCCMLLSLYFPVMCNPSRAVTLRNIGVSQYIGIPRLVTYPYNPHDTPKPTNLELRFTFDRDT